MIHVNMVTRIVMGVNVCVLHQMTLIKDIDNSALLMIVCLFFVSQLTHSGPDNVFTV